MATPAFFDVRREADRINREVPELTQKTASLREAQQKAREIQEKAEQARLAFTSVAGRLIRACDQLIETIEVLPADVAVEKAALLAQVKKDRRQAFEEVSERAQI